MSDILLRGAPEAWPLYRLGQLFSERKEKVSDTEFPPLSVTKLGILHQLETAAKSDAGDNRKGVHSGDFVINSRSDRKGSGGVSELKGSVSLISIVLEPKGIDTRFVHHLLRCTAFQEEFYRWGHGIVADLWTTRWSDMKNIRVRVPDLDTQKTIADFLDKETARIDQLIEKKQRLVELLGERVQGLLSEVVTGAFAKGHSRQTTGNAFLPQLPAHWQIATLKRLARVRGGFTLGRKLGQGVETVATPYLRVANVQAGYVDLANVATVEATKSEFLRYALRSGDVLMIEGGDNDKLGRAAVWLGEPKGAMHQNHVFAVRPKKSVYAWWIVMCSNSAYGRDYFFLNSRQSTNLASVSKTRAERFPIPLPPPSEVTELTERWRREEGELTSITGKVETSIDRLKEYRSALITAAVTGQIDVSRWGQTGEGDKRLDQIQAEMAG